MLRDRRLLLAFLVPLAGFAPAEAPAPRIVPSDDYGDAPAPYPTLDGARHATGAANGPLLGLLVDGEATGLPDANALGDDGNGVDDEDGVQIAETLRVGTAGAVQVQVSRASGLLNAWFDWNDDGDWSDAGERVATNLSLAVGTHSVPVAVPAEILPTLKTFARFRISTAAQNSVGDQASDGEVEDIAFEIDRAFPTITIESDPNPSRDGQPVTVSVHARGANPTGLVDIREGERTLGTVELVDGECEVTAPIYYPGVHALFASYRGDDRHYSSSPSALLHTVLPAPTGWSIH